MSGPLPGSTEIAGDVVRPGGTGYDDARRIYNAVHDSKPALVVRATGPTDVVGALALAERQRHDVTVRGGGHSLAGYSTSDGGLLIDLSGVDGIDVDAAGRVAVVGAGATSGQLTAATWRHGLVVPFGDSPDVGVGGITLGGGIGWLSRKHGLTLDSLQAVEIVLADGQVVLADDDERPDLFWAIRGGGGNFGVVTRFRFRLHRVGPVVGGALALPATPDVVCGVVELADDAPDDLGTISLVTRLPPLPPIPAEVHGRPAVLITLVWCGDHADGDRYVDRFRRLAPPLVDLVRRRPYPEMYSVLAGAPQSITNVTSSFLAGDLDARAIDHIVGSVEEPEGVAEGVLAAVELRVLGGAVARVPGDATAFAHRHEKIVCSVVAAGFHRSDADRHRRWVQAVAEPLAPCSKGAYLNFLDAADEDRLGEVYPPATWRRLADVKAHYDPGNVFHRNLNIRPSR